MSTYPDFIQLSSHLLVEKAQAASLPVPSVPGDGLDLALWDVSISGSTVQSGYTQAVVFINANGAATVASPKLYGYGPHGPAAASRWFLIGDLNNGTTISLTSTIGYAEVIQFPGVFTHLAVGGTVAGGNNVGYVMAPLTVVD